MKYVKPEILAQNKAQGSFAMGCPPKDCSWIIFSTCKDCERTA